MDFGLSEEQNEIAGLAKQILDDSVTPDSLRAVEDSDTPGLDRKLWQTIAEAGLLGVAVPEAYGGLGLSYLETIFLLIEAGRTVAPVPLLGHVVGATLPIARFGTDAQQAAWLPRATSGEAILTAALAEPLAEPESPATTATKTANGWRLDGVKTCVPAGAYADLAVVSAMTPEGAALFLIEPSASGLSVERQDTIAYVAEAQLVLEGVEVPDDALLGPTDGSALGWTLERLVTGVSALLIGVCAEALRLTGDYVKTREQFGHPIALFQAVGQRAADASIDTQVIRLTTLQAAWRLSVELPASKEVAVAKFYAAEGGQRVVRAAAHLHGGMGVSREYPLHRHYVWAKQLELTLGGAMGSLARLGRLLAEEPVSAG
jgi:3-oxocholest-4-en-26-oyl-CoA dehydrogenase beta subunit